MKIYIRVLKFLLESKKWLISLVFLGILRAALNLVEPLFYREVIDVLLGSTESNDIWGNLKEVLFLWGAVSLVVLFVSVVHGYLVPVYVHKMHLKTWPKAIENVLSLSVKYHTSHRAGKLMKNVNTGADNIWETQHGFLRQDLPNLITIIFLLILITFLNWKMAISTLILVPIFILIAAFVMKKTNKRQDKAEKKWSKASGYSLDSVSNITVIKSFTAFALKMKEIVKLITSAYNTQVNIQKWWTLMSSLAKLLSVLSTLSVFVVGAYLYSLDEISIGELVMFSGYAVMVVNFLENELWSFQFFMWRRARIKEFFEIWDTKPDITDDPKAKDLSDVKGKVEFRNVTFSHDKERETIKNVSFKVSSGQTVALVGHTGSGKSTTVNLLSRFFDIDSGKILIDDQDIKMATKKSLRENIGMVFQENILFHDTIKNNLIIGNVKATEKDLKKACHGAYIYDFIKNLPKGFNTVVGERGVRLSGGERQRVAIARALIKNPPIMILDEATSALDAETEQKIQKALEKLMDGRTTFIVAHRLSTIKRADKILVFDHGKIVESGTYEYLIAQKGHFAKLVEAQISGYTE